MTSPSSSPPRGMWGLVGLFGVSGVLHLVRPRPFEAIVPRRLPARRDLVYVSGAMELACAAGMTLPATRRVAGLASAGLLIAIFPANIQMTVDIMRGRSRVAKVLAVLRLPLQLPLIRTACRTWSSSPG
jgi:uncharacterized membrane protein